MKRELQKNLRLTALDLQTLHPNFIKIVTIRTVQHRFQKDLDLPSLNTLTANVHFCLLCVHLPCAIGTETVSFLNNCRIVTARVIMT